jgi:hypothetical protein
VVRESVTAGGGRNYMRNKKGEDGEIRCTLFITVGGVGLARCRQKLRF